MKNTAKRPVLRLNRVTVRTLTDSKLVAVAGGSVGCPSAGCLHGTYVGRA